VSRLIIPIVTAALGAALALGMAGCGGDESQAEPTGAVPSPTATGQPLPEVEGAAKQQYESRVCDLMIRAENAWAGTHEEQTFADVADVLASISAPADVEGFHKTLASEMKEFSETMETGSVSEVTRHLSEWQKALSEIRASGYNVKPGWSTCPTG
jgi:hypothetical protein